MDRALIARGRRDLLSWVWQALPRARRDHQDPPLLTCEAVLAETAFHLGDAGIVFDMIEEGLIRLAFDCDNHLPQFAAFAKRYRHRKPDLADLCLIRMSEVHPKHSLFTVDKDFRVYRRNKREVIPVISPTDQ